MSFRLRLNLPASQIHPPSIPVWAVTTRFLFPSAFDSHLLLFRSALCFHPLPIPSAFLCHPISSTVRFLFPPAHPPSVPTRPLFPYSSGPVPQVRGARAGLARRTGAPQVPRCNLPGLHRLGGGKQSGAPHARARGGDRVSGGSDGGRGGAGWGGGATGGVESEGRTGCAITKRAELKGPTPDTGPSVRPPSITRQDMPFTRPHLPSPPPPPRPADALPSGIPGAPRPVSPCHHHHPGMPTPPPSSIP
jgi:hypothetical protein